MSDRTPSPHHDGNKTPGAASVRPELYCPLCGHPLSRFEPVRLEGLREQDRGYMGQVWKALWCRALESDMASKLDTADSQSLPLFGFPCLQSDFTTSESCWEEERDNPLIIVLSTL